MSPYFVVVVIIVAHISTSLLIFHAMFSPNGAIWQQTSCGIDSSRPRRGVLGVSSVCGFRCIRLGDYYYPSFRPSEARLLRGCLGGENPPPLHSFLSRRSGQRPEVRTGKVKRLSFRIILKCMIALLHASRSLHVPQTASF